MDVLKVPLHGRPLDLPYGGELVEGLVSECADRLHQDIQIALPFVGVLFDLGFLDVLYGLQLVEFVFNKGIPGRGNGDHAQQNKRHQCRQRKQNSAQSQFFPMVSFMVFPFSSFRTSPHKAG